MNRVKIIVATTFRDFKGTENDEIQRMFLKSLENQTYKNFELVVTLFGEKNVQSEVEKFSFKSFFIPAILKKKYRYSLTKVVLNAIKHANSKEKDFLILWTTCDVIYENNFFETIIKNYKNNIIGTSHPHIIYSSISNFNKKIGKKEKLDSGFDLIYFDKSFLSDHKVTYALEKYIFYDWGVFEHFLIALNELNKNSNMVNIYEESKAYKISNDRKLTNESDQFLINSWKLNSITFNKFLEENKITKEYFDLTYCHFRFKLTANKFKHYYKFKQDIFEYIKRKTKRTMSKLLPKLIKDMRP